MAHAKKITKFFLVGKEQPKAMQVILCTTEDEGNDSKNKESNSSDLLDRTFFVLRKETPNLLDEVLFVSKSTQPTRTRHVKLDENLLEFEIVVQEVPNFSLAKISLASSNTINCNRIDVLPFALHARLSLQNDAQSPKRKANDISHSSEWESNGESVDESNPVNTEESTKSSQKSRKTME